jgi:O-antigen/teichoic acid export membrane protein
LWFAAGLGAVLVAIGCVVKAIFPGAVAGIDWPELLISLISVPAMLAYTFLQAILLGRGRTVGYNVGDVVLAIVPLILFVVGFAVFDMGVIGSLAIFSGAQIAASLFYLAILMRDQPAVRQPDFELMRRMLSFGLRAYLISVASYLVVRVDVLLVNGYLDEGQAGIYAIAVGLADLVALAPTIIAVNLFPRVARGGGVQMTAEVFRSVSVLFGLLCLVSIPVASVMVSVLYGSDFSTAAEIYYWLVPGVFALGMVSILSHHFAGHGIPGVIGVYWVIALVINVVMNVALLADHGTYIASLASSVCYMLVFLLCLRLFAKQAGGWSILRPSGREVVRFVRQSLSRTPA